MAKENLKVWDALKHPPKEALTTIHGGRLKGMTDIKPQWRYQVMTEQFGVCGVGWKFEYVNKWIEEGSYEQKVAFVDINLFLKIYDNWSDPIPGTGGAIFIAKENREKNPLHTSDEAFKMATTDALSTAMKMIGVAADIYLGEFSGGKYKNKSEEPTDDKTDFGNPNHPFSRDNIIEFGQHSKAGKGKDKKWLELSDKYLNLLNERVIGGYKKFIEKEIAFRKNDKELKEEKKTLTKEEVEEMNKKGKEKKKTEAKKRRDKLAAEKLAKESEENAEEPSKEESEVDDDIRKDAIKMIEDLAKNKHMGTKTKDAWIKQAKTENDPIKFHIFYTKVATSKIVCEASSKKLIDDNTKSGYFEIIKSSKTKTDDLKPIINDMKELLNPPEKENQL